MPSTGSAVTVTRRYGRSTTFCMEVSFGLSFMREQTEGQCQNERGRRAWIIFWGAHVTRRENDSANSSIERVLLQYNVVRGTGGTHHGPTRLVPVGASLEQRL
jgi:hypothetical protein